MQGPDQAFRERVGSRAEALAERMDGEAKLENLLDEIERALRHDVEEGTGDDEEGTGDDPADDLADLAAIHSWASVASYASARFYAPASPWPRSVAGWSRRAAARLQSIANTLLSALRPVAAALNAASISMTVGFPWGISIGLSW
jgi:hypothetical protein